LLLGFFSELYGKESYSSIVIGKFKSLERADGTIEIFKDIIKTEKTLQKLQKKYLFTISKQNIEGQYLITVGNFYDEEILATTYYSIKEYFPDTIIIKYKGDEIPIVQDNNTSDFHIVDDSSDFSFWFCFFFVIFLIAGILLYIQYIKKLKYNYEEMMLKNTQLLESQNLLLTTTTQRIKDSAEQLINERDKIFLRPVEELSSDMLRSASERSKSRDELLLDTTNDLIIFLQLKSKKIAIYEELFNINNILNDISGQVLSKHHNEDIELVFDVGNNVPKLMIGDSHHITTIILNLLRYALNMTQDGEIKLVISVLSLKEDDIGVEFSIFGDTLDIDADEPLNLFVPSTDEDTNNNNKNLGLHIAKELVELMGGAISTDKKDVAGIIFNVMLPLKLQSKEMSGQNHGSLRLGVKKVLIIDKNKSSAKVLEKILEHFGYDTTLRPMDKLGDEIEELVYFDMLAIDIESISRSIAENIRMIKKKNNIKVIALSNLFYDSYIDESVADVIDKHLIKPLHSERVYEVLINIFNDDTSNEAINSKSQSKKNNTDIVNIKETTSDDENETDGVKAIPKVYKGEISDTKGINEDSFKVFKGSKLLIVEDNIINQKVVLRVLNHSGINIDVANNGSEAIKMMDDSESNYDFILMDISMPIMDGYNTTKIIRENQKYDHIPIVSLTSLALNQEIKKMYRLGMNAHLTKPMKIGQLYSVFSLFLSKSNHIDIVQRFEPYENGAYLDLDVDVNYIEDSDILDTHSGIIYSQGSEVLYIEVLREFLDAYSNHFSLFEKYVYDKEYLKVKTLTKDMGGLLGAIGANSMTHLLSEINQLFVYQEEKQLSLYIESYTNELKSLIHQIEQYIYSRDRKNL